MDKKRKREREKDILKIFSSKSKYPGKHKTRIEIKKGINGGLFPFQ